MRIISDDILAALTIWMEARSESPEGMTAVGEVLLNRMKTGQWGKTIAEVVLAPYQFSCWNTTDSNRRLAALLDDSDPQYQASFAAWSAAKAGSNYAKGALFYYNPKIVAAPTWATPAKLLTVIGHHNFYKG